MTRSTPRLLAVLCPVILSTLVVIGSLTGGRELNAPQHPVPQPGPAPAVNLDVAPATQRQVPAGNDRPVVITVQLRDGATTRIQGDRLLVGAGATLGTGGNSALLADVPTRPLLTATDLQRGDATVADLKHAIALAGLDDFYTLTVPAGQDASAMLDRLAADPNVVTAYIKPEATNATLDYSARQGYKKAAPEGIGSAAAAKLPGGLGQNVRIFDIEQGWVLGHEDLKLPADTLIKNAVPFDPAADTRDPYSSKNHGTAVLGQLVARDNGFGVTGIVPGAAVSVVNASTTSSAGIAEAITIATAHAKAGDVILIEQQYNVDPNRAKGYENNYPVEAFKDDFLAIKAAVAKGVIVVEAAGNGRYDPTTYKFSGNNLNTILNYGESGAIIVGAGQVAGCDGNGTDLARSRAAFSNYGTAVDLQGPGECVATLGYGDLSKGTGPETWYTDSFSGTSSASPVVTGAVAILSSVIEQRTGRAATSSEIRDLLVKTGTAQDATVGGFIGPMPNVAKAIAGLPATGSGDDGGQDDGGSVGSDQTKPTVTGLTVRPGVGFAIESASRIPTTVLWSAKDASGINAYALMVSTDGGEWADVTPATKTATKATFDLDPASTYRFAVAARDGAGNWSEWTVGATVRPSLDDDTDPNLAFAGDWSRRGWAQALDGAVTVTSTAGDTVTITFTGRAIGWIASKGTTRGEAHVWLDGRDLGTVSLYSDTTKARAIVFSAAVTAGETHELVIEAVGTVDLDGLVFLD